MSISKFKILSTIVLTVGFVLMSCQSEAPFEEEGMGNVRLSVDVSSNMTRAAESIEDIKNSARIYITDNKGVLNKWIGVQNIPSSGFSLRYGSYAAEVTAGDSLPASFEKRYFKGSSDFSVNSENPITQVSVVCKLVNVVASIDESTINTNLIKDLTVEIGNTKGSLIYDMDHIMDYGYFMMPVDDNTLSYTVSGVNKNGNEFSKTGIIENVEAAHNYRLSFNYDPDEGENGGAFINISIADENIYDNEFNIYGPPAFAWRNNDPKGESQIIGKKGQFEDKTLVIGAYGGFESIKLITSDDEISNILGGRDFDLIKATDEGLHSFSLKGVDLEETQDKDEKKLFRYLITFTSNFLNSIPVRDTEFVISLTALDKQGKSSSFNVRIANTDAAIVYADPIIIDEGKLNSDYTAIRSRSAEIPINILSQDVVDPKLLYRKSGSSNWSSIDLFSTRTDSSDIIKLRGLEPNSQYEYKLTAEGFESEIMTFETESEFVIPNSSMEEWSDFKDNSKVLLPGAGGERTFWDSGNHGSATMSVTLTQGSEDMYHSGNKSARLRSQFVGLGGFAGKFAAGNLFAGTYLETQGTDGKLEFGRPYDGSHPHALSLWVNYRPGKVEKKGDYLQVGDMDKAQIYVALSTDPIEIRTKSSSQKLFKMDDEEIVAYGQITLSENFGPDGQLEKIVIPLDYYEKAKNTEAKYLIIVCSASYYGDYYNGGEGSLMYVDDFELIYE